MIGGGNVRQAAVTIVGSIFFSAQDSKPGLPEETAQCLMAIARGNQEMVQALSDESRYLNQWWLLNEDAIHAEKWDETRPLPQKIIYPDPSALQSA